MSLPGRLLAVAVVLALGVGGCAKAAVRAQPEAPAEVPPLTARPLVTTALLPAVPESVPVSAWVETLAAGAGLAEPERPRGGAGVGPPPDPPERPVGPPSRLGTPETADAEATTRRVNGTLARARQSLAMVEPERLSADARVQYQTARQLIEQADAAVRARNFTYAIRLADKAETLARRLAGGS